MYRVTSCSNLEKSASLPMADAGWRQGRSASHGRLRMLVVKNLLFWGAIGVSGTILYLAGRALFG
ncbi:hypothetical protein [Polymorphum gilvum]|uniref:hypothetical protein n=1 Tax=Polymorphum gilvum TaxID=991904 RepID=UPI0003040C4F|nr:hypothetical protein [Polymorphum gilvum]